MNEIINGNTFGVLFATCPKHLQPSMKDSALVFPNGSRIRLAGTDNKNYTSLRGGAAHAVFLDEACFMSDLNSGVLPTVEPMTKTTGGKLIYASTPPDTLDHDSIDILRYHDELGLTTKFTIYDDKTLTPKQLEKIINQCRGEDTVKFRREYLCERIVDDTKQVVPALNKETSEIISIDFEPDGLYNFWQKYVVLDTGLGDKSVAVFAHFNQRTRLLIVEDYVELYGKDYSTALLAQMIRDKVTKLWQHMPNQKITYVADSNNAIVNRDLSVTYGLPFYGTSKGSLKEMVQKVNDWIYEDKIRFAKPAQEVLDCCHYAIWDKSRTDFGRSTKYGHYDALAAMVYLVRNVDEFTDPVPRGHGLDPYKHLIQAGTPREENNLGKLFKSRR